MAIDPKWKQENIKVHVKDDEVTSDKIGHSIFYAIMTVTENIYIQYNLINSNL